MDYKEKMMYLEDVIWPGLEDAFRRGDEKYTGMSHNPNIVGRKADEDVRHIREIHVDVRLREAEDAADLGDLEKTLEKIESAIGYLVILHHRINAKWDPELEE